MKEIAQPGESYPPETTSLQSEKTRRRNYYVDFLTTLNSRQLPYGIIGGIGQRFYGGGRKSTNDLDLAIEPKNVGKVLDAISRVRKGWKIKHKHPNWLNQIWSSDGIDSPAFSIDLIHRHSTGLVEVKPW